MFITWILAALLQIGGKTLIVEIADTPESRRLGLMGRKSLSPESGMLFVYEEPEDLCFWMKETLIPLAIGFFNARQELIHTLEMEPPSPAAKALRLYRSQGKALYALEVPAHWFEENKILPGMKFSLRHSESVVESTDPN
jgi:uncharacterized membrane protein (UPF0127 family)